MAANLRAGFKERQHKRLFESITTVSHLTKKPRTEILCPVPISTIALALEPSIVAIGISHALVMCWTGGLLLEKMLA